MTEQTRSDAPEDETNVKVSVTVSFVPPYGVAFMTYSVLVSPMMPVNVPFGVGPMLSVPRGARFIVRVPI